ncbi:MAG: MBL fold metallo-hydrolase [Spirochaetes bacterium]|nr:MBL fold metallo-hydrolase [Spirochaetota bacterium]
MFQIESLVVGPFRMNAYLLHCPETGEGVLVDPGDEAPRLLSLVEKRGVALKAIWLTHAHIDHLGAVPALRKALGVPVSLHQGDRILAEAAKEQAALLGVGGRYEGVKADTLLKGNETLSFGPWRLRVLHTPGHSPGSCCFHYDGGGSDDLVVTGDTLFAGSVGRTDLPGGNTDHLFASIRFKLLTLPTGTRIFPGHGAPSTIGEEIAGNPFLTD